MLVLKRKKIVCVKKVSLGRAEESEGGVGCVVYSKEDACAAASAVMEKDMTIH
jgi:hypothetical protein